MQDFNSLYQDYNQAFSQGHHAGIQQAQSQTQNELKEQALSFAQEFGKQLALYQTFINQLHNSQTQDTSKLIKKIHSTILHQKANQITNKIQQIVSKLNSISSLQHLNYSVQQLQFDRKDLKSKFQTMLSILGLKQYESRALKGCESKVDSEEEEMLQF